MDQAEYTRLVRALVPVAQSAGRAIMRHYRAGVSTQLKPDSSPVTAADREAEVIILAALSQILPGVPVVAEEEASAGRTPLIGRHFLLVDPLDGTKEFIQQRDEFTVNIALIEDRRPIFGLVYAPATGQLYVTAGADAAAQAHMGADDAPVVMDRLPLAPVAARSPAADGLVVVASRSHMDDATKALIARTVVKDLKNAGSSLKFCVLAKGEADFYPRFGPTMEWDTAAGHAVLAAAGGAVTTVDNAPFLYGKADAGYRNPGFIAVGRRP